MRMSFSVGCEFLASESSQNQNPLFTVYCPRNVMHERQRRRISPMNVFNKQDDGSTSGYRMERSSNPRINLIFPNLRRNSFCLSWFFKRRRSAQPCCYPSLCAYHLRRSRNAQRCSRLQQARWLFVLGEGCKIRVEGFDEREVWRFGVAKTPSSHQTDTSFLGGVQKFAG